MTISTRDAYLAILRWQTRREHSKMELIQKLHRLEASSDVINAAIQHVIEQGLQSDLRFSEGYIRYKKATGQGPLRIRMGLKAKGIDDALAQNVMRDMQTDDTLDTSEQALSILEKKYKLKAIASLQELQKMQRFLQYRGFSHEDIKKALSIYQHKIQEVCT